MASVVSCTSLAAEVHPTKNLKAATYGDNLKITVCLVSSFTSSCSGNRDWYSATWGLSIRLPSRSWKYRNATLGVLIDCRKRTTSPTCIPSVTLFSKQPLPGYVGNNSCYGSRSTQPLHRDNKTMQHWLRHLSQCGIHAFCNQELLPCPARYHQRDARSPSRKQPRVFSFVTP